MCVKLVNATHALLKSKRVLGLLYSYTIEVSLNRIELPLTYLDFTAAPCYPFLSPQLARQRAFLREERRRARM